MSLTLLLVFAALALAGLGLLVVVGLALTRKKKPAELDDDFAGTPPPPVVERSEAAPEPEAPAADEPVAPARTIVAPVEEPPIPPIAEVPVEAPVAPVAAEEPVPEPAPVETPPVEAPPLRPGAQLDQIEKLRIPDVGLVLRVSSVTLGGEPLLAFTTEGYATRGREELVLYVRRAAFGEADVVRSLKRFAALALVVLERVEPVKAGEILKIPGEVGTVPLGGYLVLEANEPEAVALDPHFVLVGLQRRQLATEPAALRAALTGAPAPHVTSLERAEA